MNWLSNTIAHLRRGLAFKNLFKLNYMGFWKWLYYELCPSWYLYYDGFFSRSMWKEAKGWLFMHIPIGFALGLYGFSWWQTALIGLGIEVVQFFKAEAKFLNPVNSLIDIAFYVLGTLIVYWFRS